MVRVTVKRSEWGQKRLFNKYSKKMCCMGFCAKTVSATPEQMRDIGFGNQLLNDKVKKKFIKTFPALVEKQLYTDTIIASSVARQLATINDSKRRPHVKEKLIKELGAKNGIDFRFVD